MMDAPDPVQPSDGQLADLSALADGSLPPARRAEVQAAVDASPELQVLLSRERHVIELLREASERDRAPLALRERIEAARRPVRARRAPRARLVGLAGAIAAVAAVLAVVLPGGTPGSPSLAAAAALATRGAVARAPMHASDDPRGSVDANVGDLYFPDWSHRFGLRTVGERTDRIGRQTAITVYYALDGEQVAYTILTMPPLAGTAGGHRFGRTSLHTLTLAGRTVVTWVKAGHTCLLSAPSGVPAVALERYANAEGND